MSTGPLREAPSSSPMPRPEFSGPWLPNLPSEHELADPLDGDEPLPPSVVMRMVESHDRLRPASAGLLAGLVAGPAALYTLDATVLAYAQREAPSLVAARALPIALDVTLARPLAYVAAAIIGALVGGGFALLTRHLRKFPALLFWSLVASPAVLTCVYAFVARPLAPVLLDHAPYVPALIASCAFGAVLSLQLPVRRRIADVPRELR